MAHSTDSCTSSQGPSCTGKLDKAGRACEPVDSTAAAQLGTVLRMQQLTEMLQQFAGAMHNQQQQQASHVLQTFNGLSTAQAAEHPSSAAPSQAYEAETAAPASTGPIQRTVSNTAGAVLRTLSTSNPRVLALAAAAVRAPAGSTLKGAALAALKNEIVQYAQGAEPDAVNGSSQQAVAAAGEDSSLNTAATYAAAPTEQSAPSLLEQQTQPLTQDAVWAVLMAKAAARDGAATACSPLNSPLDCQQEQHHQQQHLQQHRSLSRRLACRPSPDSCQADADGTSCSLPQALLEAVQHAHQLEEEKEAAAAAAAASMEEDSMDIGRSGSPKGAVGRSNGSQRATGQLLFKRRATANSNALQRHFNAKLAAVQQQRAKPAQSDSTTATPKPHHLFKKQQRKRPLVMRAVSAGNLAGLQQANMSKKQQLLVSSPRHPAAATATAAAAEPECSNASGSSGGNGSLLSHGRLDGLRSMLPMGAAATPAATAPAVLGCETDSVSSFLSTLAHREQQLLLLQQQLREQRQTMLVKQQQLQRTTSALGDARKSNVRGPSPLAAGSGMPGSTSAVVDLQQLLGLAATAAVAASAPAVPALPAGFPAAPSTYDDEVMTDAPGSLVGMEQAIRAAAPVEDLTVVQHQQQEWPAVAAPAENRSLEALVSLASALLNAQQQPPEPVAPPPPPPPAVAATTSSLAASADILRRLTAALQPLV